MRETRVTIPELALIAGTRVALGAGLGLLLADCFREEQRRAVGWTLLLIGGLSTIPLAFEVLGGQRLATPSGWTEHAASGRRSEAGERLSQRGAFAQP
jgi:hypothetical protein